mgnify:CR=1 FL=1
MASLESVFDRDLLLSYMSADPIRQTPFWQSGAFASDNRIPKLLAAGSQDFTVPYIMDIDGNLESNYSNTILTDIAMPRGIEAGKMKGMVNYLNEGYVEANLTRALTGVEPLREIAKQIDGVWAQQAEIRAVATVNGVLNFDQANGKALSLDISKATADATSKFTVDAFIDAEALMQEKYQGNGAIIVHPKVAAAMRKQNLIEKLNFSSDLPPVEVYNGRAVVQSTRGTIIESDKGTVIGTGANAKYVSMLANANSFAAESVANSRDLILSATEQTGNGGGHVTLWTRRDMLVHPMGFSFNTDAVLTGGTKNEALSASWSDLTNAANWSMTMDAEKVPFRFLITNI